MHTIQTGEVLAGAAGALASVVWYFVRARWWRTEMGRHLMSYTSVIALLLALLVLRKVVGDYPGRAAVSTVALAALDYVIWRRLWLLVRALGRRRDEARR